MRSRRSLVILASCLALAFGCESKSSPGGPGASKAKDTTSVTGHQKGDTFKVAVPSTETSIKQGEQKEVKIKVDRGDTLKQDVTLTITPEDKEITVEPAKHTVKASDAATEFTVKVTATDKAKIGKTNVNVKAAAESGAPTEANFVLDVKGK